MTRPPAPGATQRPTLSLRSTLLIGILLPVLVLVAINTVSLYRQALRAADTAYDRTLLASAKSIGEQLEV
ncbi:MAG TPA: sensor histidine kinase N-terminal domain-containing protein, partial [Burkholderiaceae bacterium]|nr:sensor histidine kinase N-terminal domain-containing protein [Burkholderiaceae bacterium]